MLAGTISNAGDYTLPIARWLQCPCILLNLQQQVVRSVVVYWQVACSHNHSKKILKVMVMHFSYLLLIVYFSCFSVCLCLGIAFLSIMSAFFSVFITCSSQ